MPRVSPCRRLGDEGSVLALVPAGFLVLIILAAIAVDSAGAYLGQQQLHDAVSAAANDAATAALNNASFYRSGTLAIDPVAAGQVVCQSVAAQSFSDLAGVRVSMAVEGADIRVEATGTVSAVFGRALPGVGRRTVSAEADAVAAPAAVSAEPVGFPAAQPLAC